ncbi:MAG: UDP-N-acetylmuramoyl-L-alanyl-D-glutamate--2,6-diaminopimelate ligase [Bacilli bacterium]|nr:UDP-N-acetylmuramoyl-L-alanyl-D-glutamate--2,6-diaminopimelate ligase [Bacilli bacterium]
MKYETDSRLIKEGQIFVAIKGHTVDGHDYIEIAIKNGATSIITNRDLKISVPYKKVKDPEKYLHKLLVNEYSHEFKNLKIIGVTGTNGKTTTCYLIYQLLKELGQKVAYIGTIGFYYNDKYRELPNTTPDILHLYKLLLEAKENNIEYIVMEVSSHALSLERIAGIKFDIAAFTNLTQDHLDYHHTMANYLKAKIKIIDYLKKDGILILNSDDKASNKFKYHHIFEVGLNGDYKIIDYKYNPDSTVITFTIDKKNYQVKTNLINNFNIYNYLMSLAIINNLDFDIKEIIAKTNKIYPPKGRCETLKVNNSYAVIDYAHTPDAVEKIIKAYKELKIGRVITVVGCGGDRDPKKRPIMGSLSTSLSDEVIFTSDNPRTENPDDIIKDIIKENKANNYQVIVDRKKAIIAGLNKLKDNDFLLILGKGHEDYQIIGHEKIHFSDIEIVKDNIPKKQN